MISMNHVLFFTVDGCKKGLYSSQNSIKASVSEVPVNLISC